MPTRSARTAWNGGLQDGSGQVELTSSGVGTYDVSFPKRAAEDAGGTTSPEELVAAAHSSCYAMQLSALIAEAGGTPQSLEVTADVSLGRGQGGRRLQAHRHQADGPGRGRRPRRGRLQGRRREGQGRLPDQQGPRRRRHHARRRAGELSQLSRSSRRRGLPPPGGSPRRWSRCTRCRSCTPCGRRRRARRARRSRAGRPAPGPRSAGSRGHGWCRGRGSVRHPRP